MQDWASLVLVLLNFLYFIYQDVFRNGGSRCMLLWPCWNFCASRQRFGEVTWYNGAHSCYDLLVVCWINEWVYEVIDSDTFQCVSSFSFVLTLQYSRSSAVLLQLQCAKYSTRRPPALVILLPIQIIIITCAFLKKTSFVLFSIKERRQPLADKHSVVKSNSKL